MLSALLFVLFPTLHHKVRPSATSWLDFQSSVRNGESGEVVNGCYLFHGCPGVMGASFNYLKKERLDCENFLRSWLRDSTLNEESKLLRTCFRQIARQLFYSHAANGFVLVLSDGACESLRSRLVQLDTGSKFVGLQQQLLLSLRIIILREPTSLSAQLESMSKFVGMEQQILRSLRILVSQERASLLARLKTLDPEDRFGTFLNVKWLTSNLQIVPRMEARFVPPMILR